MLDHEEDVKDYREESQSEFCGVAEDGTPVLVVVGKDEHLRYGEGAACEVQEDVADAPARCALAAVVVVGLLGCDCIVFFCLLWFVKEKERK